MNNRMKFIEEGISKYNDAYNTIKYFRSELASELSEIIKSRKNWGNFKPNSRNALIADYWEGSTWGSAVAAIYDGKLNGKTLGIEIGCWWDNPKIIDKAIFYCQSNKSSDKRLKKIELAQSKSPISTLYWGRTVLYIPIKSKPELHDSINTLLDAYVKSIKNL